MTTFRRRTATAFAALCLFAATAASVHAAQPAGTGKGALPTAKAETYASLFTSKTGMRADEISAAPLPGFVEVTVGTTVYYMDHAGKWLFDGHLVDLATRTSVTAARKLALEQATQPAMDWKTLNLNDAIKTVRGAAKPGRVLVTFEDPNCGFCKRLAPELAKLEDLTVFTFPVSILGPDSRAKNEAIWCSKERAAAWDAALKGATVKPEVACDVSALDRNAELAQKLRVSGTPTLFFADGGRAPGYMEASAIEARLAGLRN